MNHKLHTIIPAALGVVGVEAVEPISQLASVPLNGAISAIVQIIIGIATIFKLFKSKNPLK